MKLPRHYTRFFKDFNKISDHFYGLPLFFLVFFLVVIAFILCRSV